ncbi:MAG: nitrite reductase/ring-hydroxylating ferredoxin subunit [Pseudohongiellaceae bacterium]|jgi:nitrite reductase/ring-hydroxylating ferredoxin subunit
MIKVLDSSELEEGKSVGIEVNNQHLFAVRKDDQLFLYWNRCPHLGTPLEWEENRFLDSDAALIQCSTHGALFQIEDGHCLVGPCKGKYLQPVAFTLDSDAMMVEEKHLKQQTPLR